MTSAAELIKPPPRSNVAGTCVIIATGIVLSVVPFSQSINPAAAMISVLIVSAALLGRDVQALHASLLAAALVCVPALAPPLRNWPFKLLTPLALYLAAAAVVPGLRRSLLWLRPGRIDRVSVLFIIAIAVLSGVALYFWHRVLHPELTVHLEHFPAMPVWAYPLAGLAFSLSNAAVEESIYRGVVMQSLDGAFGPGSVSVVVQAWLFAAMHYLGGFPNGGWGLAMTFVYGAMLGGLRRRSRGMLAPWIAHACADAAVFTILAVIVLGG